MTRRTRGRTTRRPSPAPTTATRRSSARSTSTRRSTTASGCVKATDGTDITDSAGNCGFPGFDGALAKNTLGEVAQMQENGVPVTFAYISDAHDNHTLGRASGPGEADYQPQLPSTTMRSRRSSSGCRTTASTSRTRSSSSPSTRATTSPAGRARPTRRIPARSSTTTRPALTPTSVPGEPDRRGQREHQLGAARGRAELRHPLRRRPDVLRQRPAGADEPGVAQARAGRGRRDAARPVQGWRADADRAAPRRHGRGEHAAHGQLRSEADAVVHDVRRPRLLLPDRERLQGPSPDPGVPECVNPAFAWNHGDSQDEIGNTWFGMVGPGVDQNGVDSKTWTDHVDLRPTINALLGLQDNYVDDGRVVTQIARPQGHPEGARHREFARMTSAMPTSRSTRRSGSSRRTRSSHRPRRSRRVTP